MGYYSYHSIVAKEEIVNEFINSNENASMCLQESETFEGGCKWYDLEEDLVELSKKFPENLITLTREGEERDDNVVTYCKYGTCYNDVAELIWPEFNEDRMNREIQYKVDAQKENEEQQESIKQANNFLENGKFN